MSGFVSLLSQVSLRKMCLSFRCDPSFYSGKFHKLYQKPLRLLVQFITLDQVKEAPWIHIMTHKLNGTDFLRWAHSFKDFIREQRKIAWLDGSKKAPVAGDLGYEDW